MEGIDILSCILIRLFFFFSVYQGDVYRGRRHGTGIFRHGLSPLTYEGEWHMGNMHGKVC